MRSRLDYASGLYSFCAKALLDQLDRIQNQCLSICIGVLRSTPLNVLHVETGVFPLEIRRAELARRYCVKCRASPPSAVRPLVVRAASEFQQNPFWPAKGIPLLIQAWRDTETFRTIVDKRAIKNIFAPPLKDVTHRIKSMKFPYSKEDFANSDWLTNKAFEEFRGASLRYLTYTGIYRRILSRVTSIYLLRYSHSGD